VNLTDRPHRRDLQGRRHFPGRRDLLGLAAAAGATLLAAPAWSRSLDVWEPRRAVLHNLHTGDAFNEVYYANGSYLPDALAAANRVMRDWRTGDEHFIDPGLFDALHAIQSKLETPRPFQIISGYRSPRTNAMLAGRSKGVATNSQHTLGKAIDVRLQGVELSRLRDAALAVGAGGVGFYPVSGGGRVVQDLLLLRCGRRRRRRGRRLGRRGGFSRDSGGGVLLGGGRGVLGRRRRGRPIEAEHPARRQGGQHRRACGRDPKHLPQHRPRSPLRP